MNILLAFLFLSMMIYHVECANLRGTVNYIDERTVEARLEQKAALTAVRTRVNLELASARTSAKSGGKVFANDASGSSMKLVKYTSPITGKTRYKYVVNE